MMHHPYNPPLESANATSKALGRSIPSTCKRPAQTADRCAKRYFRRHHSPDASPLLEIYVGVVEDGELEDVRLRRG